MSISRSFSALLLTLAVLSAVVTAPAVAGELAGVDLPESVEVGDASLELAGMALRKVSIIKVYVAGLYLGEPGQSGDTVLAADEPRHVVNHYLRGAGNDRLCDGWMDGLAANTPNASDAVSASFQKVCDWMGDVEKNDRFEFTYTPGTGTTLEGTGREAMTIEGKEFADALFACWIGPDPGPGEKFKQALLGR